MSTYLASGAGSDIGAGLIYVALVIGYWVPTLVAWIRGVPNKGSVTVVNLFLGWTLIGWVIALAMAVRSRPQQQPGPDIITRRSGG